MRIPMRTPLLALGLLAGLAAAAPAPRAPIDADALRSVAEKFRKHGVAQPPAKEPGRLRLATWNIHELYDEADDPALSGAEDDLPRAVPLPRREALAGVLARLDADLIVLQEIESLGALTWFRDGHLAELGYAHAAAIDVGHQIGMEQGVLSRFPILDSRVWADREIGVEPPVDGRGRSNPDAGKPMTFRRSPLLVEVDLTGAGTAGGEEDRLTVIGVHLKTGRDEGLWRSAEAAGIAAIVDELRAERPGRRIVVMGDFAVEPSEGYLAPLVSRGFHDIFTDVQAGRDEVATNIAGRRDSLILIGSPLLAQTVGEPRFVLGTPAPPERVDLEIAFQMPGFASDNYPVAVDLRVPAR
jgi:endonuclease/exonuclease/phosphatase family metal-dependent hydrolase